MKWSWQIAQVAGIKIRVHATLLILLAWVGITHYAERQDLACTLRALGFVCALFAIVVLHELGHALVAKGFGVKTRDITLLPIGGVARLERIPENPWHELAIAVAGPAVNVALAGLCFAWLVAQGSDPYRVGDLLMPGVLAVKLFWTNVALAVFNMLPAFPMDGGRVLRALLATRLEYTRATQIAASVGQGFALLFGFFGLFANPFLVFIALFVWLGAAEEASVTLMRTALHGIPVSRAMSTDFQTLAPDETLAHAVDRVLAGFQHDFPVVEHGRLVGLLTRQALLGGYAQLGATAPVREVMETSFAVAEPGEMLEAALSRATGRTLPVLREGELVGILALDHVGELALLESARRGSLTTARTRAFSRTT